MAFFLLASHVDQARLSNVRVRVGRKRKARNTKACISSQFVLLLLLCLQKHACRLRRKRSRGGGRGRSLLLTFSKDDEGATLKEKAELRKTD